VGYEKKVADLVDKFTGTILPAFTNHFSRVKHTGNEQIVKKNKTGGDPSGNSEFWRTALSAANDGLGRYRCSPSPF